MLRVLLAKDLRRAWRNPLPWLINLIVPLAITALLGMVFGGRSDNGALGRIRFAVVDEDQSALGGYLRSAANQGKGTNYLEPVFLGREEALRLVNAGKISAVFIIPTNFARDYVEGRKGVSLELIKNPAESIHPAVLEELLGTVVTALNAVSRNFRSEFPKWQPLFEGKEDYYEVSSLIGQAGDKIKAARQFLDPPLVSYEKPGTGGGAGRAESGVRKSDRANTNGSPAQGAPAQSTPAKKAKAQDNGSKGVFAYLLVGLSGMFLLFLGQNAMTDLHRELRKRTFERYQTIRQALGPFIFSKVIFAVVVLLLCSAIMLGGGGLIFRIHWRQPLPLALLALGYVCFVAALFAVLVAVVPDERRAGVLNNLAGMGLGLAGGCAFPPNMLPAFVREHLTPHMPSYWFADTARNLQFSDTGVAWAPVLLKLALLSVVLLVAATILFRRKFKTGLRT